MSETIRFIREFPDKVTPKCLQLMSLQVPDSKSPQKNYFPNVVRGLQAKTTIWSNLHLISVSDTKGHHTELMLNFQQVLEKHSTAKRIKELQHRHREHRVIKMKNEGVV